MAAPPTAFRLVANAGDDFLQVLWSSDVPPDHVEGFLALPTAFVADVIGAGPQALAHALRAPPAMIAASAKSYSQLPDPSPVALSPQPSKLVIVRRQNVSNSSVPASASVVPPESSTAVPSQVKVAAKRGRPPGRASASVAQSYLTKPEPKKRARGSEEPGGVSVTSFPGPSRVKKMGRKRVDQATNDAIEGAEEMKRCADQWDGKTQSVEGDAGRRDLLAAMQMAFTQAGFKAEGVFAHRKDQTMRFGCRRGGVGQVEGGLDLRIGCEFSGRIEKGQDTNWTVRIECPTHNHPPEMGLPTPVIKWAQIERRIIGEHILRGNENQEELLQKLLERRRADGIMLMPTKRSLELQINRLKEERKKRTPEGFKSWLGIPEDGQLPDGLSAIQPSATSSTIAAPADASGFTCGSRSESVDSEDEPLDGFPLHATKFELLDTA